MSEEQTQSANTDSAHNSTHSQGVTVTNSTAQAPQDVTASVNTQQQPQVQNPFVVNAPTIPTQEGPMGIRYDFNDGARVLSNDTKEGRAQNRRVDIVLIKENNNY